MSPERNDLQRSAGWQARLSSSFARHLQRLPDCVEQSTLFDKAERSRLGTTPPGHADLRLLPSEQRPDSGLYWAGQELGMRMEISKHVGFYVVLRILCYTRLALAQRLRISDQMWKLDKGPFAISSKSVPAFLECN